VPRRRLRPPTRPLRAYRPVGILLTAVAAASALTGCGSDGRTALAIDEVTWHGPGALRITTECSTEVEVEVGVDHGGSGLPEVTVWGRPSIGRCRPAVTVRVPRGTTRIVDGTTSLVIDLPEPPA
jgi:hypothetical protein